MKNPFRKLWRRGRQYPVEFDERGRSKRQACFEEFDAGKRPVQISREYEFNTNTVYTYWKQWQKLPNNWHKRREHLKLAKKADPDFFTEAAFQAGGKLGMSRLEVLAHLERPYGLLGLIQGKWPLHDTTPATNEAITILRDLVWVVFWGGFQRDHPRNIVRDLEADGVDFTEKRIKLIYHDTSDEHDNSTSKAQTDEEDSDDE
ncbi:MAG: hypothetical protein GY845_10130 [Planctomycetes bacterium]|nr:hypothetical protein [Planctomycetota bacterium]